MVESQKNLTLTTDHIDNSTNKKVKTSKSGNSDNFEIEVSVNFILQTVKS
jgi:hypothetical protein